MPEITKRRVTMRNFVAVSPTEVHTHEAVDYVTPDFLDAYVEDARLRWQSVEVSEEPDAGPGGYHGQTVVPGPSGDPNNPDEFLPGLKHPAAGTVRAATQEN